MAPAAEYRYSRLIDSGAKEASVIPDLPGWQLAALYRPARAVGEATT